MKKVFTENARNPEAVSVTASKDGCCNEVSLVFPCDVMKLVSAYLCHGFTVSLEPVYIAPTVEIVEPEKKKDEE